MTVAAVALALEVVAVEQARAAGEGVDAARKRVGRRRRELRAALSPEDARRVEAHVRLTSSDLGAVRSLNPHEQGRLLQGFAHGVSFAREHALLSSSAVAHAARGSRFAALADMLIDRALGANAVELVKLSVQLAGAARLEHLAALEVERRSREARAHVFGTLDPTRVDLGFAAELLNRGRTPTTDGPGGARAAPASPDPDPPAPAPTTRRL